LATHCEIGDELVIANQICNEEGMPATTKTSDDMLVMGLHSLSSNIPGKL